MPRQSGLRRVFMRWFPNQCSPPKRSLSCWVYLGILVSFLNKHLWHKWCASTPKDGPQKMGYVYVFKIYKPPVYSPMFQILHETYDWNLYTNWGFPNHWLFGVILQAICRCWAIFVPIPAALLFIRTRQETRFAVQEIQKKNITLAEQAIWKLVLRGGMPSKHCESNYLFCRIHVLEFTQKNGC